MGSRKLLPFKFIWIFIFVISVLAPTTESQSQVCSIQGIDLGLCLIQRNSSFSIDGTCCEVLNKVVRAGYNCLCLLLASSFPLLNTPISLPLSNCFIHLPPLTLCQVVAPMPIMFPPNSTNQTNLPSLPPEDMPVSPPNEMQFSINSTGKNSSTTVATQPPSSKNADTTVSPPQEMQVSLNSSGDNSTKNAATEPPSYEIASPESTVSRKGSETSKGRDKIKIMLRRSLFLSLAFLSCIILA
ncbi:uncharacterized protein LOC112534548 isoform X1 [Ricinus communis]|uniref:uncharacterized protein LOC112534548 isoform X1 n=1 Tax=Ricinus communis TaxID=3988 RepID=UPI000D68FB40|nr:uncharacterized protein LOC112534548 isoform X1 [Ricinus communis]|eukprot:XP_025012752.1 uncharacterized protein LOC112534548 isoform X1 [Ricinus communis]